MRPSSGRACGHAHQRDGQVLERTRVHIDYDEVFEYANPALAIAQAANDRMARFMTAFGLTPEARTRVRSDLAEGKKTGMEGMLAG